VFFFGKAGCSWVKNIKKERYKASFSVKKNFHETGISPAMLISNDYGGGEKYF
jgi:hypothetical protein